MTSDRKVCGEMSLASGQTLSFYEILAPLGAGGMGEVYRARDTRLEREVAIKVLPDEVAEDEERLRRFEREAKTLATLHHPNVASIFGIDQVGDTCFLALELVPGQDLAELVARGPLPLEEALDVCRQIAEGLEAAHEAGVVHRDLKPANVRVTPERVAKVLDFGLAKPMPRGPSGSTAQSDSFLATADGRVLGTPTYMSPEQARGRPVDRRTDIWAFGCVLYECLVGRRAFAGENLADILSAIVGSEPDLGALPPATPLRVRELLRRCLEKDPRRRLRDIGEARLVLEDPGAPATETLSVSRSGGGALPWSLAGCLALALVAVLWSGADSEDPAPRSNAHLSISLPPGDLLQVTKGQAERGMLALSPDGRRVVYAVVDGQSSHLEVRELDSFESRVLAGTTSGSTPFLSPDGRWVGFFSGGELKKVPIDGGEPVALCEAGLERGAAWGPNGAIVASLSSTSPLTLVPADGGEPRPLTELDPARHERTHRWPAFLPDGKSVLFTVGTTDSPGDYDDARIDVVDLETGERHTLLEGASYARATDDGHLLFGRERTVSVMRLADADGGPPRAARVFRADVASLPASGVFFFELARDGTLVYAVEDPNSGQYELAWVDDQGVAQPAGFPVHEYQTPRLSPDGRSVAVTIGPGRGRGGDVYIGDLASGTLRRLTFDERSTYPVWTPDGTRVAFTHSVQGPDGTRQCIGWKAADGSDETELLLEFEDAVPRAPCSFTPDGSMLLFLQDGGPGHSSDLLYADLESGELHPVATESYVEWGAQLSPDGRFLAYQTDETGVSAVYITSFPELKGRWQLSGLGQAPRWSPDGSAILFTANGTVMRAGVRTAPSFRFEQPTERFPLRFHAWNDIFTNFDVADDGRLLVLRSPAGESRETRLHVILNALEGF